MSHAEAPEIMMNDLNAMLEPGMLVRHPDCPDWGLGQVQSVIGNKITVNFRGAGKVVIDGARVMLVPEILADR
jgi:hypothetical protein